MLISPQAQHSSQSEENTHLHTELGSCLLPLLDALGWKGDQRQLHEAMPKMRGAFELGAFLNTMANMNYESVASRLSPCDLPAQVLPCLWVDDRGEAAVILKPVDNEKFLIYRGRDREYQECELSYDKGTLLKFSPMSADSGSLLQKQKYWFLALSLRFKQLYLLGFATSIFLSLLALMSPIFVMAVYSQLQVAGATPPLLMIGLGIALYIASDLVFRSLRGQVFAHLSQRMSYILSTQVLRRILMLPPTMTENASTQAQISRIREFENISQFFSGPAIHGILDLITTSILLLGMTWLGGSLVYVPLFALIIALTFGAFVRSVISKSSAASSKGDSKRQELLFEIFNHFRSLKILRVGDSLLEQYQNISSEASLQNLHMTQVHTLVTTFGQILNQVAGVCTMVFGVVMAMEGDLPSSSLLACMLLTWKILAPIRNLFTVITQMENTVKSVSQLNRFMNLIQESQAEANTTLAQSLSGDIVFNGVSMKSSSELQPALMGVQLTAKKNQITIICGHGGVDGSNVIEAVMRLRDHQSGSISINGMNIRQFDPFELRNSISYSPQSTDLFQISLLDNLLLAHPTASEEDLQEAIALAHLEEDLQKLPDGIQTLVDGREEQFSDSFLKRFNLARAWLKPASIQFYHLPDQGLTHSRILELKDSLKSKKADKTIIVVSNNRDLFEIADAAIWLDQGKVINSGDPSDVSQQFYAAS